MTEQPQPSLPPTKPHSFPRLTGLITAAASLIVILTWLGVRPPALKHPPAVKPAKASRASRKADAPAPAPKKAEVQEKALDGSVTPVTGGWQYHGGKVSVSGTVFEGYGTLTKDAPFATFDARDWDTFTCSIGVDESQGTPAPEFEVSLEAGARRWEWTVKAGRRPQTVQVKLQGATAVTVRCGKARNADDTRYTGDLSALVFAEPKYTPKEK